MKNRIILLILILMSGIALPAAATPIVSDLSHYRIDMDANFRGSRMFLFGTRNDTGDVVVVIRGANKNFVVRKKEDIAGIWVNHGRVKIFDVPSFYMVSTSKPLSEIQQATLFSRLRIGQETLVENSTSPTEENYQPYLDAFLERQRNLGLYSTNAESLGFMAETLFKTTIEFPANLPSGNYTAEIYLISDDEITGMQTIPIKVRKTGLDAFLSGYAHDHPALYGITAVVIALSIGWLAGRIFEKI